MNGYFSKEARLREERRLWQERIDALEARLSELETEAASVPRTEQEQ